MRLAGALAALIALAGCSEPPKTVTEQKKEEPKALEPLTGRQAFQQMYIAARQWATDCQPLQLKSIPMGDVKATPGKSGAWQAVFVSPSRSRAKSFTWSAVESEGNLHKGVFAGQEESYAPSRQSQPFLIAAIKTDSDEAYETALKKSPALKTVEKTINFVLEQTPRFPDLAWRIFWGDSVGTAQYTAFVDATTGQLLERAR